MTVYLDDYVPVVKNHGLNTQKPTRVENTLVVTSTLTVSGTSTLAAISSSSSILTTTTTAAIGYTTGAGGTVTQITSRTTGVTLSRPCGSIITDTTSLAAETTATFTVTNTVVAIGDVVVCAQRSGANSGNTNVYVSAVAAGSFNITVANNNAAAGTAETGAITINFAVIRAVTA